jgi:hypothetical protein
MATMTTADLATALDTTPRTLRKFLRSDASGIEGVGKGSRYSIEAKQVRSLRSRFSKWTIEQEARKADKAPEAPEVDNEVEAPTA